MLQMWTTASFPACPVAAREPELDRAMQVMSLEWPANNFCVFVARSCTTPSAADA